MPKPNTWADLDLGPGFRTIIVGTKQWMAENLAIDDGGAGIVHYDNVTANGVNFGTQYYYTRAAADRIAAAMGNGWHLPAIAEWDALGVAASGSVTTAGPKLKSTSGWDNDANGDDSLSWTGLPCGHDEYRDGLLYAGREGVWLSSSIAIDYDRPYNYSLLYNDSWLSRTIASRQNHYTVRLVRDI